MLLYRVSFCKQGVVLGGHTKGLLKTNIFLYNVGISAYFYIQREGFI